MEFKELLKLIAEDSQINSYVALEEIFLLPKLIKKDSKLIAELFYLKSDVSMGRYTVYPISHRVLYDIEEKRTVSMECIIKHDIDYNIPLGSYQKLLEKNGIESSISAKYAELFVKIAAKGNDVNDKDLTDLSTLWEQCIPVEIKNTIS